MKTGAGLYRACGMLAVLLSAFICLDAEASITVTKANTSGALVDGSSVDQTVNFSAADFGGSDTISKVTITVSFAKLSPAANKMPQFKDVAFTLSSATGSVALIQAGSFGPGKKGTSFDGTIIFDMAAADFVNIDTKLIQDGTFRPDGGNLDDFLGGQAVGDWTLTITDAKAKKKPEDYTPLIVSDWSVSITTVPEPDSIGLWSMTAILAAMIVFHRPRRRSETVADC